MLHARPALIAYQIFPAPTCSINNTAHVRAVHRGEGVDVAVTKSPLINADRGTKKHHATLLRLRGLSKIAKSGIKCAFCLNDRDSRFYDNLISSIFHTLFICFV